MAFDKKNITDIEQAKSAKYGLSGKEREPDNNEKKNIFDPYVGEGIIEIQNLSELFNEVIKAEQSTSFDQTIYDKLSRSQTSQKKIYEAINKNSGQYDIVLGNLFSKKQQTPTPGTPTDEAGVKAQIGLLDANIANRQDEINKKVKQRDAINNNAALTLGQQLEAEEKVKKAKEFRARITDPTNADANGKPAVPVSVTLPTISGINLDNNNNNG